jgi:hypothetical protein
MAADQKKKEDFDFFFFLIRVHLRESAVSFPG